MKPPLPGDTIRVRSIEKILATLDERGTLDGVPFMPEMLTFCGRVGIVSHRAHKFCIENGAMGTFGDVVFLEGTRCSGSSHQGCQRECLLFWKTAWLETLDGVPFDERRGSGSMTVEALRQLTAAGERFFCQSSELPYVAKVLPWWQLNQYLNDVRAGHASSLAVIKSLFVLLIVKVRSYWRQKWHRAGKPARKARPAPLHLKAGDLVQVRSYREIKRLLDKDGRDRGMAFSPDMREFCGKTFRVRGRVSNVILEHNPRMYHLSDTVTLEGVTCAGKCRRLCPRASYLFWRESWLIRVAEPVQEKVLAELPHEAGALVEEKQVLAPVSPLTSQ